MIDGIVARMRDSSATVNACGRTTDAAALEQALADAGQLADELQSGNASEQRVALLRLVDRIDVADEQVRVMLKPSAFDHSESDKLNILVPAHRVRRGHDVRLVVAPAEAVPTVKRDARLIELIVEARVACRAVIDSGCSITEAASRLGKCRGRLAELMRISYLAPDIVEAVLDGRQPSSLTRRKLASIELPRCWSEQKRALGFV